MRCPFCGLTDSRVVDSRPTDENVSIRRRRECEHCGKRFTTYETIENLPLVVVKKNGSRQSFDRQKLLHSILRACDKRSVTLKQMEDLATEIEQGLQNNLEREITSTQIGEQVMDGLRHIDEVAYVRFASVYRQFTDVSTFLTEVNRLITEKK